MRRAGTAEANLTTDNTESTEEGEIEEEDQKVIVRSNGTVGYVGKDIAYHMWKFGLLGRDFGYRKFYRYPNAHECWISTTPDDPEAAADHPHFGDVTENYNVIDARQSEAQNTVIEALKDLGHGEAAGRLTHFSYGMVVLTPRCAAELGYEADRRRKVPPLDRGQWTQRVWRQSGRPARSADRLGQEGGRSRAIRNSPNPRGSVSRRRSPLAPFATSC